MITQLRRNKTRTTASTFKSLGPNPVAASPPRQRVGLKVERESSRQGVEGITRGVAEGLAGCANKGGSRENYNLYF